MMRALLRCFGVAVVLSSVLLAGCGCDDCGSGCGSGCSSCSMANSYNEGPVVVYPSTTAPSVTSPSGTPTPNAEIIDLPPALNTKAR